MVTDPKGKHASQHSCQRRVVFYITLLIIIIIIMIIIIIIIIVDLLVCFNTLEPTPTEYTLDEQQC